MAYERLPGDGLCLNAFLIVRQRGHPDRALLGRIDPAAPWDRLGALETARRAQIGERWMLPCSQLLLFEAPQEAARRLVREQLELEELPLRGPKVFSEAYDRPPAAAADPHWDLHFLFRGELDRPPVASPWKELAFVEVAATPRDAFARAHGDVLALAGLPPKA